MPQRILTGVEVVEYDQWKNTCFCVLTYQVSVPATEVVSCLGSAPVAVTTYSFSTVEERVRLTKEACELLVQELQESYRSR